MPNYAVALLIFCVTFFFILSGKLNRTIASFVGALLMVLAGVTMGFYSQEDAFHAIDFNMIGLLVGMMVIVSVCKKTGFFSYVAVKTAKASGGSPLRLMIMMGVITAVLSMLLDNITTVILVIPITVLICDILGISPLPIIMAEIVLSNIGGVGTMIGDPPNMMIASASEFSFDDFIIHLLPPSIMGILIGTGLLAFFFRKELSKKPRDFTPIRNINERAAIKDIVSFRNVIIALVVVLVLFSFQKRHGFHHAFIAFIGAGIVLALVRPNIEEVMKDIEWPVLIFFASLFILIGGIERTGVLEIVSGRIIKIAEINYDLAKISILWSSAFFASLVDRIPFTTAMIPIIKHAGAMGLNVDSLWWFLALGVGFGGNGTPIGSMVGVVGLALSEKTNSPISLKVWLKTATIIMLATIAFATLLVRVL